MLTADGVHRHVQSLLGSSVICFALIRVSECCSPLHLMISHGHLLREHHIGPQDVLHSTGHRERFVKQAFLGPQTWRADAAHAAQNPMKLPKSCSFLAVDQNHVDVQALVQSQAGLSRPPTRQNRKRSLHRRVRAPRL